VNNAAPLDAQKVEDEFRARFGVGLWYPRVVNEIRMLVQAITEAVHLC